MKKNISIFVIIILAFVTHIAYGLTSDKQLEINKRNVVEFYNVAINQKDFEAAKVYFGSKYIQHNPTAADGIEGFKAFIQFLRNNYPYAHSEIKKVFA